MIFGKNIQEWTKGHGLPKVDHNPSSFLKAVFHKFYLVHSSILCPIYCNLNLEINAINTFFCKAKEINDSTRIHPSVEADIKMIMLIVEHNTTE